MIIKKLDENEILFIEGDVGTEMYIIKSGKLKIMKREGSKTIHLATLGAGAMLGEMSLLDGSPRSATVRTLSPVEVACISKDEFDGACAKMPTWLLSLLKILVSRLRETNSKKFAQDIKTATTCAACLIAEYSQGFWPHPLQNEGLLAIQDVAEIAQSIQGLNSADVRQQIKRMSQFQLFSIVKNKRDQDCICDIQLNDLKEFIAWNSHEQTTEEKQTLRESRFGVFFQ